MKMRRIVSIFLLCVLLTSLFMVPQAFAVEDPHIAAKAALLVEQDTGAILYAENEHQREYPASITKIMTALLVLEAVDRGEMSLQQKVTVKASSLANLDEDGSTAGIVAGEVLSVEDLLYCMLVVSANETCNILADETAGSISAFVDLMNQRAAELGCTDTHFANPNGLHDANHYTSAWDIYLIARECMKNETFMTICNSKAYTVPATNLEPERELHSTNYLISTWRATGYYYDDARGIKTGSTPEAGHCLVSSAVRSGRTLVSVVLGAQEVTLPNGENQVQSFSETSRLFDWGFDNFSKKIILNETDTVMEVPVALSKETNYVVVHPQSNVTAVLPNDLDPSELQREIKLTADTAQAPITEGDVLGQITLSYDGVTYGSAPLLAMSSVSASRFLQMEYAVTSFFSRTIVKVVIVLLILLLIALAVWNRFFRRARRYGGKNSGRVRHNSYRGRRR